MSKYFAALIAMCCLSLSAQTGREFWFAAPDITSGHNDSPVYMRVSTYNTASSVELSLPANPSFVPIRVTLAANSTYSFDLSPFLHLIESRSPDSVLANGIKIFATADITAYYEISSGNNIDIYSLKAENGLGRDFLISAQSHWIAGVYSPLPYASASIVATKKNTKVTITPSVAVYGHAAGVPYNVWLNEGESYTIRAIDTTLAARFGGTEISSNKPVAVTITDDSMGSTVYGSCRDMIGDQTIPMSNIGSDYVVVKGFLGPKGNKPDRVYIMATVDSTEVYLDGSNVPIYLNKGESHEEILSADNLYISGTSDLYVMHVSGFGCEVGMAIVPAINCTGSNEVSFSRSQDGDFYIVAMIPAGSEGDFLVNGQNNYLTAADFIPVPGTGGGWVSARKHFTPSEIVIGQNYRVTNSSSNFHLGIINGESYRSCLYGFFSDFAAIRTPPIYHY